MATKKSLLCFTHAKKQISALLLGYGILKQYSGTVWYVPLEAVYKGEAWILTLQFAVEQGTPSSMLHPVFATEGTDLAVVLLHIKGYPTFCCIQNVRRSRGVLGGCFKTVARWFVF